jgi:hypothetical protein
MTVAELFRRVATSAMASDGWISGWRQRLDSWVAATAGSVGGGASPERVCIEGAASRAGNSEDEAMQGQSQLLAAGSNGGGAAA